MYRSYQILSYPLGLFTLCVIHLAARGQTPRPVPATYPSIIYRSYVRVWDGTAPEQTPNTLMTRPLQDIKQTTQCVDGFGRPLQTVVKQGSLVTVGVAADMLSMVEYDIFGREQVKY